MDQVIKQASRLFQTCRLLLLKCGRSRLWGKGAGLELLGLEGQWSGWLVGGWGWGGGRNAWLFGRRFLGISIGACC